mmetsp:Transcript_39329/g.63386  ORF Transcript_39329/g.63386 Transcript_39329/m.63386 type:complete len:104 (-) Transcript_39329:2268-2579(-)
MAESLLSSSLLAMGYFQRKSFETIRLLVATHVLPLLPTFCWLSAAKCDSGGADRWGREWLPRSRLATTHTCNTCFCPPTSCPQLVLFVLMGRRRSNVDGKRML